jgi:hypothetical protein
MTSSQQHAELLRKTYEGPMGKDEIELLRDMQSFLEFCIRNGLSFIVAMGTLNHDINHIAQHGFSLDATKASGVFPKVSGYSKINKDSVGEPDEQAG